MKAALAKQPAPYSNDELTDIAAHCTEREDAENKVERTVRKTVAALLLHDQIGETFDAIVTGANPKGTFVRTLHPPAEGMVVRERREVRRRRQGEGEAGRRGSVQGIHRFRGTELRRPRSLLRNGNDNSNCASNAERAE